MGYSPQSIVACFNTVHQAIPQTVNGGISVPGGKKSGYHSSVNENMRKWPGNYSILRALDLQGDRDAGRALDITFYRAEDIRRCTERLIHAIVKRDPRVQGLREIIGTLDSIRVTGMDVHDVRYFTADPSHLYHIHLSWYTKFALDHAMAQHIAAVITGAGTPAKPPPPQGADLNEKETEQMIAQAMRAVFLGSDGKGRFTPKKYPNWVKDEKNGIADRLVRLEKKVKP